MKLLNFAVITVCVMALLSSCDNDKKNEPVRRGKVIYKAAVVFTVHDSEGNNLLVTQGEKLIDDKTTVVYDGVTYTIARDNGSNIYGIDSYNLENSMGSNGDKYVVDSVARKSLPCDGYIVGDIMMGAATGHKISFNWADKSVDEFELAMNVTYSDPKQDTVYPVVNSAGPFLHNHNEIKVERYASLHTVLFHIDIIK